MTAYRMLALLTSIATVARAVGYRMLGIPEPAPRGFFLWWHGWWPEVCLLIGALLLFWIGTQKMGRRRAAEVRGVGMLGGVLLLVHELPFVAELLFGFIPEGRPVVELLAVVPLALCLLLIYLALRAIVGDAADS